MEKIQGNCNFPLIDERIREDKVVGKYFRDKGISFDVSYSSTQEKIKIYIDNYKFYYIFKPI